MRTVRNMHHHGSHPPSMQFALARQVENTENNHEIHSSPEYCKSIDAGRRNTGVNGNVVRAGSTARFGIARD